VRIVAPAARRRWLLTVSTVRAAARGEGEGEGEGEVRSGRWLLPLPLLAVPDCWSLIADHWSLFADRS
ncbi:MAG TPA: hypothetical protein VLB51_03960, partial [Methylomirabilota bacterium]|nr:hypothetical protein [Methylomirabilota bacterium]